MLFRFFARHDAPPYLPHALGGVEVMSSFWERRAKNAEWMRDAALLKGLLGPSHDIFEAPRLQHLHHFALRQAGKRVLCAWIRGLHDYVT